jgi:hypothetical protein
MRRLWIALLLAAGCSNSRVPEDHWYPQAVILCQRQDCPHCGGTRGVTCGKCDGAKEVVCSECRGSGIVRCSKCKGSGKDGDNKCDRCDGTGKCKCSTCGGDGKVTCDLCDGKGKTACLQRLPVSEPPVADPADAWPPGNFKGAKQK